MKVFTRTSLRPCDSGSQNLKKRVTRISCGPWSWPLRKMRSKVQGRPLSLYIYSDLIENSDYLSGRKFFSTPVDRLIGQLRKDKLIAPLKNANVLAAGVGRGGTKDRRPLGVAEQQKVTEFWTAYFKESGATSVEVGQNIFGSSK